MRLGGRKRAAAPAVLEAPCLKAFRASGADAPSPSGLTAIATRLAKGRTVENLLRVMEVGVLSVSSKSDENPEVVRLAPRQGLTAMHRGDPVLILDTCSRRGRLLADVAALRPAGTAAPAGAVMCLKSGSHDVCQTVPQTELTDVALRFSLHSVVRGSAYFALAEVSPTPNQVGLVLSQLQAAVARSTGPAPSPRTEADIP
eukprot:3024948-Karenia_brevis.AAC.1